MKLGSRAREKREGRRGKAANRLSRLWPPLVRAVALLIVMGVACLAVMNIMMTNDTFEITFYRVSSDKLINNMRTVIVSDIHMAEYGADNAKLIAAIERLKPDFISVTGDVNIYKKDGLEYTCDLCAQLAAIAPTYYVLGNHELDEIIFSDVDYRAAIPLTGVTLLHNTTIETTINGNAVVLSGMSFRYSDLEEYAPNYLEGFLSKEGYRVLLTHYPESFQEGLADAEIDLAMCGHAHGGQVRLPYVGALYTPDQGLLPELTEGCLDYGNTTLVISRGLGNSGSIPRINNMPELVVVDMCSY